MNDDIESNEDVIGSEDIIGHENIDVVLEDLGISQDDFDYDVVGGSNW